MLWKSENTLKSSFQKIKIVFKHKIRLKNKKQIRYSIF